jgi:hypothetical protein
VEEKWYTVTYRGPAEMVVWVLAETPEGARQRAEDGNYDDASDVEFIKGKPYTMKVMVAPTYVPPERY